MNKKELLLELSNVTELTQKDNEIVINAFISVVTKELQKGEQVAIAGFGTFKKVDKAARIGINPATGAKIDIAPKSVPKFVPAKLFKDSF